MRRLPRSFDPLVALSLVLAGCGGGGGSTPAPAPTPTPAPTPSPSPTPTPTPMAARPNVVVILADDMGFADIGAYGSEIPTPNLDALAASGLRFTQFYNGARCSPSRAALLTGLYPHEAGLGHLAGYVIPNQPGTIGHLADRAVTMAQVLQTAGYYTGMAGKWHLGITDGAAPWQRGFDRSLASAAGELYFKDQTNPNAQYVYIDSRQVRSTSDEIDPSYWYSSDLFVDWDTRFMNEAQTAGKPFFLYLPFVGVHFPLMAPADEIAKFKGKYLQDWDALRQSRLNRQKAMGIVDANTTLTQRLPESYNWNKLSAADRDRYDTMMAVYAAAVSRIDRAVGTLVARLKAAGQFDNTLILFMADNGGNAESGPDGISEGGPLGSAQSNVRTGLNWATLQNTPFSYFKHYTEEGGISAPFIASWPQGIAARLNGSLVREPSHLIDVMPTVVALTGASYPSTFNGNTILPMEGRSLAPAFTGQTLTRSVPLFWMHEGNRAVRDGKWKLVARYQQPWRLFDMSVDRTETRDLASANPSIVATMSAQYDAWARRAYVDPWPGPVVDGGVIKGRLAATASD